MPRTDLGLMGLNQVGFGPQNQQKQCSTQASPTNRLYSSQLVDPIEKKSEFLRKYSLKNKESNKKRCTILSSNEGDTIETGPSAPNLTYFNKLRLN